MKSQKIGDVYFKQNPEPEIIAVPNQEFKVGDKVEVINDGGYSNLKVGFKSNVTYVHSKYLVNISEFEYTVQCRHLVKI
jgi:hypothetical protein